MQTTLEEVKTDIFRLEEQAKYIFDEKANVASYLEARAEDTKSRLMFELKLFENEVIGLVNRSMNGTKVIN